MLPGQLEQPAGALAAHGQRVEGPGEIRRRRRRRGQVAHGVDLAPRPSSSDLLADVGHDEAEALVPEQVGHVLPRAGGEVVEADDGVAPLDQAVAQVRAQEAGAAGHHDPAHWRPIPVYWKPMRRTAAGSSRLRASTMLGSAMAAEHAGEVEPAELVPLGEHDQDPGPGRRLVGVGPQLQAVQVVGRVGLGVDGGVEGLHGGAQLGEAVGDLQARRVAPVVGVGLEGEAPDGDRRPVDASRRRPPRPWRPPGTAARRWRRWHRPAARSRSPPRRRCAAGPGCPWAGTSRPSPGPGAGTRSRCACRSPARAGRRGRRPRPPRTGRPGR